MTTSGFKGLNSRENLTSRYRLRDFDYSTPGYYFITIPTNQRRELLGQIYDFRMNLSEFGTIVTQLVSEAASKFPYLTVEQSVVMPNHLHLLLNIGLENEITTPSHLVKWLKGASTAAYRVGVRDGRFPDAGPKVWQVGFNDEIVRNDVHLANVIRYMDENVAKWAEDELYRD